MSKSRQVTLPLSLDQHLDAAALQNLCGPDNSHIKRIETNYNVCFFGQQGNWHIEGVRCADAAQA
ncbi:MAG: PhoH family protein, partial [Mariprofundus sp.]